MTTLPPPEPPYPGDVPPPAYPESPGAAAPPRYPIPEPQYPTAGLPYPAPEPHYGAQPYAATPQPYGTVPPQPYGSPLHPAPAAPPGLRPADDPAHPHHISTEQRRVHIAERQRWADAAAVGNLLLHLPNLLCSLCVVVALSAALGRLGPIIVLAWLASGVLLFHRPTESVIARYALRLRHPSLQERERLAPVWREVTARAGVEDRDYELWIEDSDDLNAVAAAGHIVGVTRYALNELPNGELAAVLAHELGHHVGGHAWSSLLGYWYALPGRIVWRALRAVGTVLFKVSRAFSCFGVGFLVLVLGSFAFATVSSLYGLPLLFLALPYALAAVGRKAELRADQHAAVLGFAPMLGAVLHRRHTAEQYHRAVLAARLGGAPPVESTATRLLSSHPDHSTRMHHLAPYLQQPRP